MSKLLAWLQLCRFAAVFTAMADIFLGYLLTHRDGIEDWPQCLLLVGGSACLYLAGMVFNDVFDREIDLHERPKRPIPSGRISVRGATTFGAILVGTGCLLAGLVGSPSLVVAGLLVAAIFLYDGVLKATWVGPVSMGTCRFLNVMLGASALPALDQGAAVGPAAIWKVPQLVVAIGLGIYIVGVTWFARQEAGQSRRVPLVGALLTVNLGLVMLISFVMHWQAPHPRSWDAAVLLGCIGMVINRRLVVAVADPVPAKVQASIRTMLLSLIMLDAALILFVQADRTYAFGVAMLLLPAMILGKKLAIT
ncbi:MAG: UbiA family prenyltransferase [Planctomycetes bacterium]|nr:UbiA family prenyltransferase [Planctomycetota bacterium]